MMSPPSDKLHNVLLANRPDAIPDDNITVQCISGKSQTTGASEPTSDTDGLQANLTNAVVCVFSEAERNSSANQPMRSRDAEKDFEIANRVGSHWPFTQYRLSACY
jgi:hypothetical protein